MRDTFFARASAWCHLDRRRFCERAGDVTGVKVTGRFLRPRSTRPRRQRSDGGGDGQAQIGQAGDQRADGDLAFETRQGAPMQK